MDVAYILSPARSGSTFLQFLLSGHPEVVGLGEVRQVLKEYRRNGGPVKRSRGCSCGKKAEHCSFWGPVLRDLPGLSHQAAFNRVLTQFESLFPGKVLIDSSKSGAFLESHYLPALLAAEGSEINLKVLYLVRDFRGWVTSVKKHRARVSRTSWWFDSEVLTSYNWLYSSIKWLCRVRRHQIEVLPVYYEHLVFDTNHQLRRIFSFLGVNGFDVTASSSKEVHELYGSASMKSDPHGSSRIVYDTSWMENVGFVAWGALFILPAMFNMYYARKISVDEEDD